MTSRGLLLTFTAALLTVGANLMMRSGVLRAGGLKLAGGTVFLQLLRMAREPMFLLGAVFYILSALVWFSVISTEQLSTAYPILVSLTFLLVTAGSVCFFHEAVSAAKAAGVVIILGGIWIVATR